MPALAGLIAFDIEANGAGGPNGFAAANWAQVQIALDAHKAHAVQLRDVAISGNIVDDFADLQLTQTFNNDSDDVYAESAYFFPLNLASGVYDITVRIGNERVVRGKVMSKEEAAEKFTKAKEEGRTAAMLTRSEESEDVYKLRIGSIPARSLIAVTIGFCLPLSPEAGSPGTSRLVLPTALLHRYTPAASAGSDVAEAVASTVDDVLGRLRAGTEQAGMSLTFDIRSHDVITAVSTPSHAAISDWRANDVYDGGHATQVHVQVPQSLWINPVRFADFHLDVARTPQRVPYGYIEKAAPPTATTVTSDASASSTRSASGGVSGLLSSIAAAVGVGGAGRGPSLSERYAHASTAALVLPGDLVNKIATATMPARPASNYEVVFLIDRSGSMTGPRIVQARSALQLALRSLPAGRTWFNIISFGSDNVSMFPGRSVPLNEENLARASAQVGSMDADMGGTEILSALQAAVTCTTMGVGPGAGQGGGPGRRGPRSPAATATGASPAASASVGAVVSGMLARITGRSPAATAATPSNDAASGIKASPAASDAATGISASSDSAAAEAPRTKRIFLFTDGEVSNTRECVDYARSKGIPVFTFGIGSAVSTALVQGIAEGTNATFQYISDEERFNSKVVASMQQALSESYTLGVAWGVPTANLILPDASTTTTVFGKMSAAFYTVVDASASESIKPAVTVTRISDGATITLPIDTISLGGGGASSAAGGSGASAAVGGGGAASSSSTSSAPSPAPLLPNDAAAAVGGGGATATTVPAALANDTHVRVLVMPAGSTVLKHMVARQYLGQLEAQETLARNQPSERRRYGIRRPAEQEDLPPWLPFPAAPSANAPGAAAALERALRFADHSAIATAQTNLKSAIVQASISLQMLSRHTALFAEDTVVNPDALKATQERLAKLPAGDKPADPAGVNDAIKSLLGGNFNAPQAHRSLDDAMEEAMAAPSFAARGGGGGMMRSRAAPMAKGGAAVYASRSAAPSAMAMPVALSASVAPVRVYAMSSSSSSAPMREKAAATLQRMSVSAARADSDDDECDDGITMAASCSEDMSMPSAPPPPSGGYAMAPPPPSSSSYAMPSSAPVARRSAQSHSRSPAASAGVGGSSAVRPGLSVAQQFDIFITLQSADGSFAPSAALASLTKSSQADIEAFAATLPASFAALASLSAEDLKRVAATAIAAALIAGKFAQFADELVLFDERVQAWLDSKVKGDKVAVVVAVRALVA